MKETFSNNLKQFRKQKQLSQEQLAEQLGITTQAVSKWECGLSYPDIDLLPQLADLFCVSIDTLLRGNPDGATPNDDPPNQARSPRDAADNHIPFPQPDLPDDDVLRIVQYRGKTLLRKDTYDPNIRIPLSVNCDNQTKSFRKKVFISVKTSDTPSVPIEIWGSADIFGDLEGSASVGTSLNCAGDIHGNVNACTCVTCSGDINGSANAGQNISCSGDINGDANTGHGDITCEGDINGTTSAQGGITCNGDIGGNVTADGSISCGGDIGGNASAGTSLSCGGDIGGDICAGSNVDCGGDIGGDIRAGGNVDCGGDINGHVSAHR